MMARSALLLGSLVTLASLAACGSDGGGAGGAGGDGKYRPPGNGSHITEDAACQALLSAQNARAQALACTTTSYPCPTLVQVMVGGTVCREYDQGSVQGCVDYYGKQATCEALRAATDACVAASFEGSEPAGCP
jgi:hypothetical protein